MLRKNQCKLYAVTQDRGMMVRSGGSITLAELEELLRHQAFSNKVTNNTLGSWSKPNKLLKFERTDEMRLSCQLLKEQLDTFGLRTECF